MKLFKKVTAMALASMMTISMMACGGSDSSTTTAASGDTTTAAADAAKDTAQEAQTAAPAVLNSICPILPLNGGKCKRQTVQIPLGLLP